MDPHFWVWVLMGGGAAWLLSRVLRPPAPEEQADTPTADRVAHLCRALSGDSTRDRPLMNRVLALGPGVVPTLVQVLAEDIREEGPAARLARLEDLLAEFGLAAVPPLAEQLGRLRLTSGLAASLVRVLRRLGQPGLTALVTLALDQPALAPCLPRFRRPASAGPFPPVAAEGGSTRPQVLKFHPLFRRRRPVTRRASATWQPRCRPRWPLGRGVCTAPIWIGWWG